MFGVEKLYFNQIRHTRYLKYAFAAALTVQSKSTAETTAKDLKVTSNPEYATSNCECQSKMALKPPILGQTN